MQISQAIQNDSLLKKFCTPPSEPVRKSEQKVLETATRFEIGFKHSIIKCYSFGEGPAILLCHGWGSRAGHLVLLARILSKGGFQVVLFDAPGHTSFEAESIDPVSTMFEYAEALSAVANSIGKLHAVIGHSMGAMATIFILAKRPQHEKLIFACKRFVSISAPASFDLVIKSFCSYHKLKKSECNTLRSGLESGFEMKICDYDCLASINSISIPHLIVQDEHDEYFPPEETLLAAGSNENRTILKTQNLGHDKILVNRDVARGIVGFLQ